MLIRSIYYYDDTTTTQNYTLSLHDALPISKCGLATQRRAGTRWRENIPGGKNHWPVRLPARIELNGPVIFSTGYVLRSEEHTSELQSRRDLVCRLLLEKKK